MEIILPHNGLVVLLASVLVTCISLGICGLFRNSKETTLSTYIFLGCFLGIMLGGVLFGLALELVETN